MSVQKLCGPEISRFFTAYATNFEQFMAVFNYYNYTGEKDYFKLDLLK